MRSSYDVRVTGDQREVSIFHSKTIDQNVSYLVYFPPEYDKDETKRYPVLYHLPASGGTPKSGSDLARRLDKAIRAGIASPIIIVSVNGLRGNTMYCDSRDGLYWKTNDSFLLIPKNADALRDRTMIRIVCHIEDE